MYMGQAMVAIVQDQCTGCDMCITHCPFEALLPLNFNPEGRKHNKRPVVVIEENCVGCLSCIGSCPTNALYEVTNPPISLHSPLLNPESRPDVIRINRWGKGGNKWA